MKFCENCGAQLEDSAVFCEECGTKVENSEASSDLKQNSSESGNTIKKESRKKSKDRFPKRVVDNKTVAMWVLLTLSFALFFGAFAYVEYNNKKMEQSAIEKEEVDKSVEKNGKNKDKDKEKEKKDVEKEESNNASEESSSEFKIQTMDEAATNTTESTTTTPEPFTGYTDTELIQASQTYINTVYQEYPTFVEIDSRSGNQVMIHLYGETDSWIYSYDWYTIDIMTGRGTNIIGDTIDLTPYL